MVMGFDYHATALAAAGLESRTGFQPVSKSGTGQAGSPSYLDGVNLIPFVTGKSSGRPHEQLFWRAGLQHAARVGDWKLVTIPQLGGPMLFNLRDDIGEQNNLAASQPAKLKELQSAFAEWEKGTQPAKWVRQDQRNAEPGGKLKTSPSPAPKGKGKAKAGARVDDAFKAADKNNDGKLSKDEYPQPEIFDALDANKDGTATLEEVRTYYRNRRAQPAPNQ
jgi:hypothetical protein